MRGSGSPALLYRQKTEVRNCSHGGRRLKQSMTEKEERIAPKSGGLLKLREKSQYSGSWLECQTSVGKPGLNPRGTLGQFYTHSSSLLRKAVVKGQSVKRTLHAMLSFLGEYVNNGRSVTQGRAHV